MSPYLRAPGKHHKAGVYAALAPSLACTLLTKAIIEQGAQKPHLYKMFVEIDATGKTLKEPATVTASGIFLFCTVF